MSRDSSLTRRVSRRLRVERDRRGPAAGGLGLRPVLRGGRPGRIQEIRKYKELHPEEFATPAQEGPETRQVRAQPRLTA